MRFIAAIVCTALLLAGCTTSPSPATPETPGETPKPIVLTQQFAIDDSGIHLFGGNATWETPIAWSQTDWSLGNAPPAWRSEPFLSDVIVHDMEMELQFVANDQALTWPAVRSGFTAWIGTDGWAVDHLFFGGPDTMAAGDTFTAKDSVGIPAGGMWIPAGQTLELFVGTYYQNPTNPSPLALFGDMDLQSTITWNASFHSPTTKQWKVESTSAYETTTAMCPSYTAGTGALGELEIDNDTHALRIQVIPTSTTGGHSDIDIFFNTPDGNYWGGGHGPGNGEVVLLGPNNIADNLGTWTMETWCMPQQTSFTVTVDKISR